MARPTIAMISAHTCPIASLEGKETGGLNVYVLELSKALAKLGWQVDMYTSSQDKRRPKVVEVSAHARVIHVPAGPERPYPKARLLQHLDEFNHNIREFANRQNITYDLLHCHYYLSGLIGLKFRKVQRRRDPLVVNFHTLGLMKNLVARETHEREGASRIAAERSLCESADNLIATSVSDKEYLMYLYGCPPAKIAVIAPGVDIDLFRVLDKAQAKRFIGAGANHRIILAVGRMEPLKGFDVLLYALKIILSRHPRFPQPVSLWIVGGDVSQKPFVWSRELNKLNKLRADLGIATVVKFVGQQPQASLPYYYSAADVVVMPSHYESFGMAALEAMACGTPIIATNVTGISPLIQKKALGVVTSTNNPLLLAAQIEELLTDTTGHQRLRQLAHRQAAQFSWERVARQMQTIYRRLLL